ncbi:unnamed protein product [Rotaria socialis]|uniref:Uncharacterized protein n=1 Tax=Rotaria socialis TaxID=392032 RepID=A0A818LKM1_9BILA|nr:unnamed protein product [Rotaria socialis]CAF4465571.1 unnamed protein product [Rotaria socialis]
MASTNDDEYVGGERNRSSFFYRSLSPCSFERLRTENSDYFYKPKRGPSTMKSNITITRPIKTFESVTKLVELLTKKPTNGQNQNGENIESSSSLSKTLHEQKSSSSHYSSLLSMDDGDASSSSSSTFSSRSNSSISTIPEHESQVVVIEEEISELLIPTTVPSQNEESNLTLDDQKDNYSSPSYDVPAIGIDITMTGVALVLIELYPQNVDYSTVIFQRYLISLILNNENKNWSISNVKLQTIIEQEANLRLFTLTHDEFDHVLVHLQSFITYNSSMPSPFVLNIALTGEQKYDYELKISSRLNKINLNFDIIQYRAESYMIGLDFFLGNNQMINIDNQDELIDTLDNKIMTDEYQLYPYILLHAEAASTFFYIVHSPSNYSVLTSNNLCYKTYSNLMKFLQPGYDPTNDELMNSSSTIRRPSPVSYDFTRLNLCKNCHRSSTNFSFQVPLTSFTRIPQRHLPSDYTHSSTSHYIYRGWMNRRTSSYDANLITYDVHTQTDDSFLELSSLQTCLAMHRSLLSMFTMNMALIIKLLLKLYPSVNYCMLTGEFFQLEKQARQDLTAFLQSIVGQNTPRICQLKREPLIAALGCALPRVYFDVLDEEGIVGSDCIS